jgi:hypothetical protein
LHQAFALGSDEAASACYEQAVKKPDCRAEAWLEYIAFERQRGEFDKVRSLLRRATAKCSNNPEPIHKAWIEFEQIFGDNVTYYDACEKIMAAQQRHAKVRRRHGAAHV